MWYGMSMGARNHQSIQQELLASRVYVVSIGTIQLPVFHKS